MSSINVHKEDKIYGVLKTVTKCYVCNEHFLHIIEESNKNICDKCNGENNE